MEVKILFREPNYLFPARFQLQACKLQQLFLSDKKVYLKLSLSSL